MISFICTNFGALAISFKCESFTCMEELTLDVYIIHRFRYNLLQNSYAICFQKLA